MYEPGKRSEYSGGGITISQLILTDITHQPYEKYMNEQVLKPLGMIASSFAQPPVNIKPELLATGYDMSGKEIPGKFHIYPEQAAAGLWTNPSDLSKYIIETQLSYEGKSQKVLNQITTRLRLTPYLDSKAALGVFIDDFNNNIYFEHSGSNEGFMSQYYGSLSGGDGLVIMVNSDNGAIIREIVNSIANIYQFKGLYHSKTRKKIPVDVSALKGYTGKYTLPNNFVVNITREGDSLFIQPANQPKFQLFPEAPDKFFLTIVDGEIEFIKDASGKVTKLLYSQDGGPKQEGKKSED
jgi:CubicO group peptidase (beta-lactamase class C family)